MCLILHIETSGDLCSVALSDKNILLGQLESEEPRTHAAELTILIGRLLEESGKKIGQLQAVAVSKGPGSYTGLRIGVSTAKGICFAHDLPLIAINTLEALADGMLEFERIKMEYLGFGTKDYLCPLIDARRKEVYTALFDATGEMVKGTEALILDEKLHEEYMKEHMVVFLGSGAEKASEIIKNPNAIFIYRVQSRAQFLIKPAWKAYQESKFEDTAYFEPYYLKDFIATVPKKNIPGLGKA